MSPSFIMDYQAFSTPHPACTCGLRFHDNWFQRLYEDQTGQAIDPGVNVEDVLKPLDQPTEMTALKYGTIRSTSSLISVPGKRGKEAPLDMGGGLEFLHGHFC